MLGGGLSTLLLNLWRSKVRVGCRARYIIIRCQRNAVKEAPSDHAVQAPLSFSLDETNAPRDAQYWICCYAATFELILADCQCRYKHFFFTEENSESLLS